MKVQPNPLLADHTDMRLVPLDADESPSDRNRIVQLAPDHPGFLDQEYRGRRNQIAEIALRYSSGQIIPAAPYTMAEHLVWRAVWQALGVAHQRYACADYLRCLDWLDFDHNRIPQLM